MLTHVCVLCVVAFNTGLALFLDLKPGKKYTLGPCRKSKAHHSASVTELTSFLELKTVSSQTRCLFALPFLKVCISSAPKQLKSVTVTKATSNQLGIHGGSKLQF